MPAKRVPKRNGKGRLSKRRGQQTKYTEAIADEICERLANGESLIAICTSSPHLPSEYVVRQWAIDDRADKGGIGRGFASKYARARAAGYERLADEIIDISDAPIMFEGRPDNALVQQARLRSDNRKWFLSKVLPKRFGDKVTQEITSDPSAPLLTRIELVAVPPRARIEDSKPVLDHESDEE
jgi:Bacteriophage Sf6, terminase small subunit-like